LVARIQKFLAFNAAVKHQVNRINQFKADVEIFLEINLNLKRNL